MLIKNIKINFANIKANIKANLSNNNPSVLTDAQGIDKLSKANDKSNSSTNNLTDLSTQNRLTTKGFIKPKFNLTAACTKRAERAQSKMIAKLVKLMIIVYQML